MIHFAMSLPLYLTFLAAVAVLLLIPGPNVALIVANSVAHGTRYGLLTVLGTAAAMLLQLAVAAFGMTAALGALGHWFEVVRWVGVGYLLWIGWHAWMAPPVDLGTVRAQPPEAWRIVGRGALVSLCNPKTLLFYGAFLPQFVSPASGAAGFGPGMQLAVLSASFMAMAVLFDSTWAIAAGRARRLLAGRRRLHNRVSGGMLMGAGVGLALVRRS